VVELKELFPHRAGAYKVISEIKPVAAPFFRQAVHEKYFVHYGIINFTERFIDTLHTLHVFITTGGAFYRRLINLDDHIIYIPHKYTMPI
jgi:hypothetical protein